MKHFLIAFIFFSIPYISFAQGLSCVGMDGTGKTINVIYHLETDTINVNGDISKIASKSPDKKTMTSQPYLTANGTMSKVTLTQDNPQSERAVLKQFNVKDNKLITIVPLACRKLNRELI